MTFPSGILSTLDAQVLEWGYALLIASLFWNMPDMVVGNLDGVDRSRRRHFDQELVLVDHGDPSPTEIGPSPFLIDGAHGLSDQSVEVADRAVLV